jgi:hypothetical protein
LWSVSGEIHPTCTEKSSRNQWVNVLKTALSAINAPLELPYDAILVLKNENIFLNRKMCLQ